MAKSAKEIAEQAMTGFRAVETPQRDSRTIPDSDQVGSDLEKLKSVYAPDSAAAAPSPAGRRARPRTAATGKHTKMVVMEPRNPTDAATGRKVVLVREDEEDVSGFQG